MQLNNLTKQVALYARVSSEEQREGQTIDSQITELERFAKQSGWQITKVYKDEGWSGAALARPALDQMRDDSSRGSFQAVLINDVDRLARDVSHLGVIKRDLERQGAQVIFRKLPAEKSPTQSLMVNILGSFAEFERELITDRTRRGRRHKVETRKQYLGCIAPYGFRYTPKNRATGTDGILEVNPAEARVVRQMYSWVDREGLSARRVLDRLNLDGIRPRNGSKKWAKSSVLRILRSEVYAGVWYYNKYESCEPVRPFKNDKYRRSMKTGRRLRGRSEWFRVELPKHIHILAREQWERVQRQLDKNRAFSPRNSKRTYLLTGLVRCGGCGRRYVGEPCHGKFYYRCNARCKKAPTVKESSLNESVWTALRQAILNPRIIIQSVTKLSELRIAESTSNKMELSEIEKAIQQVEIEEARILEAYRMGAISAALLGSELEKLNVRRSPLQARKSSLNNPPAMPSLPAITQAVSDYCASTAHRLDTLNIEERKRLLHLLVNEIVFDGFSAEIKGVIPNPESGQGRLSDDADSPVEESSLGRIETTEITHCGRNTAMEFLITAAVAQRTVSKCEPQSGSQR